MSILFDDAFFFGMLKRVMRRLSHSSTTASWRESATVLCVFGYGRDLAINPKEQPV